VWKFMHHLTGEARFVLAGSGHIAGVVNPPSKQRYQHWINEQRVTTLQEFIAGATEFKGSWWPDWVRWLGQRSGAKVAVTGARVPGQGKVPALEDAPGTYVRTR
jgi:polyhydroxyalkanoate synthase